MAGCMDRSVFHQAVEKVLDSWTALQLAVQHGFGGIESVSKARWMVDAINQWFSENDNLEPWEVEEFLAEIMSTEFDTIADDNSTSQVADKICKYHQMCTTGRESEVLQCLGTLRKAALTKCVAEPEDEEMEEEVDESHVQAQLGQLSLSSVQESTSSLSPVQESTSSQADTAGATENTEPKEENLEDSEWTTVSKGGKRKKGKKR